MSYKKHDRRYDLVVLGATGYTGALTAEHIASHFPPGLKWAVAGRSEDKLKQLVADCKALDSDRIPPEIEVCNVSDEELRTLVRKTFVLITTLGPYARYGEPAFKACAEAGTHYLDCTGEVPFTHAMIKKYEATAKSSGAWMFPQSGLESAPPDVLTWSLVSTIQSELSAPTSDVILALHRLDSMPTGGTLASFMDMFELFPVKTLLGALKPYALSPVSNDHPGPKKSFFASLTGLTSVPGLGLLSTSPTGGMNAASVFRTWGLTKQEPSLKQGFYGPQFTYQEFMKPANALAGILTHYALLMSAVLLLCPPVRALTRKIVFKPGDGPDKVQAKNDKIELRAVGKPDIENTDKQAFGKLSYDGSMYYLTAALLAQAAATILEDGAVGLSGGIYTPSCLGQGYVDRLNKAGVKIEAEIRKV